MNSSEIAEKTKKNALFMHINPIGLIRMGSNNEERLNNFNIFLNDIQTAGGNIAIPSYSYSYTKSEIYNIKHSPCTLDEVSEYLRQQNLMKRTSDPNFSYLLFGDNFSSHHFEFGDSSSFGSHSLIEEVFLKDGYIGAIGGAIEYLTEIHLIEKKLKVNYRFDKFFYGESIDFYGKKLSNKSIYYCRDLKKNYSASFIQLKNDLKKSGLVEEWLLDNNRLKIEVIKFSTVYNFIKEKILENPKYLWSK